MFAESWKLSIPSTLNSQAGRMPRETVCTTVVVIPPSGGFFQLFLHCLANFCLRVSKSGFLVIRTGIRIDHGRLDHVAVTIRGAIQLYLIYRLAVSEKFVQP